MKKNIVMFKERLFEKNEDGFSLLELVVAIGILLVLTVGGLIGYSQITKNARTAAVEKAAADVFTGAMVELNGGNYSAEGVRGVADKWNDSASDNSMTAESELRKSSSGEDCVFVRVSGEKDYFAEKTNCGSDSEGNTDGGSDNTGSDGSTGSESGNTDSGGSAGVGSGSDGSEGGESSDGSGNSGDSGSNGGEETPVIPTGKYSYRFGGGDIHVFSDGNGFINEGDSLNYKVSYEVGGETICSAPQDTLMMDGSWEDGYVDLWGMTTCNSKSDIKVDKISDITVVIYFEGKPIQRRVLNSSMIDMDSWDGDTYIVEFMPDTISWY